MQYILNHTYHPIAIDQAYKTDQLIKCNPTITVDTTYLVKRALANASLILQPPENSLAEEETTML